ncbi:MAG TPA: hypothetical protein DCR55_02445 [Lentisphaeria bacterium]|nr:hypothetical protein [Lentisphaeria bacterium]
MQVCSYIIHNTPNHGSELLSCLAEVPGCEAKKAADGLVVLVTESDSEAGEQDLQTSLKSLSAIGCLVQAFGTIA